MGPVNEVAAIFLTLGAILATARLARAGAHLLHVPQVSLLMLVGLAAGPMGFDLVPDVVRASVYPPLAEATLAMVGFLLGSELSFRNLVERGRAVVAISLAVTLLSFAVVGAGLWGLVGLGGAAAAVLACASVATDPAAVQSVIQESRAEGPLSKTLLGIVAIDDLWGILLFSLVVAFIPGAEDGGLWVGLLESGGSIALGAALGGVLALVSRGLDKEEPTLAEALAAVLLAVGLSEWLGLSYLLTAVAMGTVVATASGGGVRSFRDVEGIEWPFLVVFFVLSGASIAPAGLSGTLPAVAAYVVLRVLSRLVAGWLGARIARADPAANGIGLALLPQAGVALGLVLVVSERIPAVGEQALPVVVLGTIVFEVGGPVLTRRFLQRVGEAPRQPQ